MITTLSPVTISDESPVDVNVADPETTLGELL